MGQERQSKPARRARHPVDVARVSLALRLTHGNRSPRLTPWATDLLPLRGSGLVLSRFPIQSKLPSVSGHSRKQFIQLSDRLDLSDTSSDAHGMIFRVRVRAPRRDDVNNHPSRPRIQSGDSVTIIQITPIRTRRYKSAPGRE